MINFSFHFPGIKSYHPREKPHQGKLNGELSHSQAQSAKIVLIGDKLIHLGKFWVFLPNFLNYHFLGFLPSILKIKLAR